MLRLISVLVCVGATLTVGACGADNKAQSPAESTVSAATHDSSQHATGRSSFVTAVNEICGTINHEIVSLPKDTTAAAYFYDTRLMLALAPRWAAELGGIRPPAAAALAYHELLRLNNQQTLLTACGPVYGCKPRPTWHRAQDRSPHFPNCGALQPHCNLAPAAGMRIKCRAQQLAQTATVAARCATR